VKRIRISPWPFGHIAALAIRDDDINYFTQPYKIEDIYRRAWKQGLKVTLGAVPKIREIDDLCVPPNRRGRLLHHSLCDNKELVKYLKEKLLMRQIDLAQHGYTHERLNGKPEFYINNSLEIKKRLVSGRKILEECLLLKVKVFFPPQDRISKKAWEVLRQEKLALCRRDRILNILKNTPWSLDKTIALTKLLIRNPSLNKHPLAGGVLRFSGMIDMHYAYWHKSLAKWAGSGSYSDRIRWAEEKFTKVMKMRGVFIVLNHYWDYYGDWSDSIEDYEMLRSFYHLLEVLSSHNIWKTTVPEVVEWIRKLDKVEVRVRGKEVIVKSPVSIDGVTVVGENCSLTPIDEADVRVKEEKGTTDVVYERFEPGEKRLAFSR